MFEGRAEDLNDLNGAMWDLSDDEKECFVKALKDLGIIDYEE